MDASILLVGSHSFIETFTGFVRQLSTFVVEGVSTPREAMSIVQAQQPDVLVLQARQPGSLDLCQQIKSQNHLAWIYCITIASTSESGAHHPEIAADAMQWEIQALEMGTDAYLTLDFQHIGNRLVAPIWSDAFLPEQLTQKRLQTYLNIGVRQVRNHRELMRTNDILSAIALVDPLTELNNRRAFEWELPRQIQNSQTRHLPISLIMMDVDFFKNINDTYGHRVGDRVLQLISARLRHNLRFYDTPFRYGGEEFVILLSDTDLDEATIIANRLRMLIGSQPFMINESLELSITISAGVGSLAAIDDSKGISLLERADHNLLRAKSQGRNRVVVSTAELFELSPLPRPTPSHCSLGDEH